VAHANPITEGDGVKLKGEATSRENPFPDGLGDPVQMGVTGKDVIVGIGNPDEWFFHDIFVGETHSLEKGPVRSPLRPF